MFVHPRIEVCPLQDRDPGVRVALGPDLFFLSAKDAMAFAEGLQDAAAKSVEFARGLEEVAV